MTYIDLSHTFTDNMPAYFGDPPTTLKQITTIAKNGYVDHQLTTVMHVGTHMDAPLHMIENGKYMDEIPLGHFAGPGVFVDARGKKEIDHTLVSNMPQGSIVLVCTGMSAKYGTESYEKEYPTITQSFAEQLVASGAKIVGMDILNPDTEETFPVHKILLSKEILIIENLTNLESLLGVKSFDVFAFPMKLHAEAAPVRVVASIK